MDYPFNLFQNNYTICPPNWGMTDECASFHRIYYVCGGEAYQKKENINLLLEQGYLYVFPVMKPYTLWHNPHNPLEVLWFHVECHFPLGTDVEKIKIIENTELFHLLKSIQFLQKKLENFSDVQQIFDVLLRQLSNVLHCKPNLSTRMNKVLAYLNECQNMGIYPTVTDLAEHIGMERSYFSRFFHNEFHMSPQRYLLARRMNLASKALMEGQSIWSAAQLAGYQNEKAFSRAFKAYMEITPANYRKKYPERL